MCRTYKSHDVWYVLDMGLGGSDSWGMLDMRKKFVFGISWFGFLGNQTSVVLHYSLIWLNTQYRIVCSSGAGQINQSILFLDLISCKIMQCRHEMLALSCRNCISLHRHIGDTFTSWTVASIRTLFFPCLSITLIDCDLNPHTCFTLDLLTLRLAWRAAVQHSSNGTTYFPEFNPKSTTACLFQHITCLRCNQTCHWKLLQASFFQHGFIRCDEIPISYRQI